MNNARYLLAQIGKRSERQRANLLPLDPSELPDGAWKIYSEKRWRSGRFGNDGELSRRAAESGTYDVLRTYSQAGASKAALIEIRQLATQVDAVSKLPRTQLKLQITSARRESTLTDARLVEVPLESGSNSILFYEQFASRGDRHNVYRYAVDSIERVVFLTAWVTSEEESAWEDVFQLSTLQADRIRRIFTNEVI